MVVVSIALSQHESQIQNTSNVFFISSYLQLHQHVALRGTPIHTQLSDVRLNCVLLHCLQLLQ